jgi:hypothetical protein
MTAERRSSEVALPELCRAAWPPNPGRVRDALNELAALGLVELRAVPSGSRISAEDRELLMRDETGAAVGAVRIR